MRLLDTIFLREKGYKRETKLLNMLMFVKTNLWKVSRKLFINFDLIDKNIGFRRIFSEEKPINWSAVAITRVIVNLLDFCVSNLG